MIRDENDQHFSESLLKAYERIARKGGARIVCRKDVPADAKFLGNRSDPSIKDPGTPDKLGGFYKAILTENL